MWPVMVYGGEGFFCLPVWARGWLAGPGVYVLCRRGLDGRVRVLHVDATENLASLGSGAAWDAAAADGMTEIHVHALTAGAAARAALAARLRQRHPTPRDPANGVHQALARLGGAFAPPARTLLEWIESVLVAPFVPPPEAVAVRQAPPRLRPRAAGRGR